MLQPIFLRQLLRYYNTWEVNEFEAYMYALGIILCSAINVFVIHPYMMAILHMGMKIRVACCSLIYRKALRLTRTALGETTIGQAVNLLSNDVNRFDISIIFLHYLWIGPLETIIITFFMYYVFDIGLSAIIGVASLLLFIPLQGKTIPDSIQQIPVSDRVRLCPSYPNPRICALNSRCNRHTSYGLIYELIKDFK